MKRIASDLSTIRTASDLSTIQFRLIFKGHKSLEYWCLVTHLTSVSTISYAESNGVAFFSKYLKAAQPNVTCELRFAKVAVSMSKIPCKIVQFSRIFLKTQGYLWIIWIIWVKICSSLNFYFVAIDDDWRSTIADPLKMRAETYTRQGTGAPASN
jgi:hypothetical protein